MKTYFPETIVAVISLYFVFWLFPTVVEIQNIVRIVSPDNSSLMISSAIAVLILGLYLIIGAYFFMISLEHYIYLIYLRIVNNKSQKTDEL
jgi:hypothetical protein